MLSIPSSGVYPSVNVHRSKFQVLCDWIEGCSVFMEEEELSASQIVDILCESLVYKEQNFAWEMVDNIFRELKRREELMGELSGIHVDNESIKRLMHWKDVPAYSFCLVLSFPYLYPEWAKQFCDDYTTQGSLFELLTLESLKAIFPGWEVVRTGWAPDHVVTIEDVSKNISERLNEKLGDIEHWVNPRANEAGLDVLCYRPFRDYRVGIPVFLMQCASGKNWEEKVRLPEMRVWTKIIQFASEPKKAFSIPFALSDQEFARKCNQVNGMLLDRYRILSPGCTGLNWLSDGLRDSLITWLEDRVQSLPFESN